MLKKRIAAILIIKDGIVVQSINFRKYLPVGKSDIAIEFLNLWGIDEIILLDISATRNGKTPNYELIKNASKKCFVPLTVGGGISKVEHIEQLMHSGSDKISLNSSAISNPKLISDASHIFGNQCVVVSIDAVQTDTGYKVYDYLSKKPLEISPDEWARKAQDFGAGEILINSVDRDGSYKGYDIELISNVCNAVSIPVICAGGAKNADSFISVFNDTNVSAASAANFFHFTEHSVICTKSIINNSIPLRLETFSTYSENKFDKNLRLIKKSDQELEDMLFIRIEKEII